MAETDDLPPDLDPIIAARNNELAYILARGNQLLMEDEEAFLAKRSASDVRVAALACLASIEELFRAAQEAGLPKFRSGYSLPLPLQNLRQGLVEVEQGRRSMLLDPRPDRKHLNPADYTRVVIKAEAVAALNVLIKHGEKLDVAAAQIANILERVGFAKPDRDGTPYKGGAIIEWRKIAKGHRPDQAKEALTKLAKDQEAEFEICLLEIRAKSPAGKKDNYKGKFLQELGEHFSKMLFLLPDL